MVVQVIIGDVARRMVVVAAVMLLVGACSDGGSVAPGTSSTVAVPSSSSTPVPPASETPSPTASPVTAPVLPAAAKQPTRAGAEAFLTYFWAVYDYSFDGLDSSLLSSISARECGYCSATTKTVAAAKKQGLSYRGGGITVRVVVAAPGQPTEGLLVNALIDQSRGVSLASDGQAKETVAAQPNQRVEALVRWQSGKWHAVAVVVKKPGEK